MFHAFIPIDLLGVLEHSLLTVAFLLCLHSMRSCKLQYQPPIGAVCFACVCSFLRIEMRLLNRAFVLPSVS
jgi:hypothetical protein